jgi:hypothetical protein
LAQEGYLWPTAEQELLLRASLFAGKEGLASYHEWARRVDIDALDYGSLRMLPLLYRNLRRLGTESPHLDRLKGTYRQTYYQNKLAFYRGFALLNSLKEAGIETMILKGAAMISLYYGDPGLRPMSDFDILVPPGQALAAIAAIRCSGWQPRKGIPLNAKTVTVHYSWPFSLPATTELDLHWYVFDQCCYPKADDELWDAAVTGCVDGSSVRGLCATDQLLHTCIHGMEWNTVSPLRWVADAAIIFDRDADRIDWDRLIRHAQQRRLILAARDTLTYLRDKFHAPVPQDVLSELRRTPVAVNDRLEYRARTSPPGNFPSLRKIYFGYRRHRALVPTGGGNPMGFVRYLQARWGVSSLWKLPITGSGLVFASLRGRFSLSNRGALQQAGRAAAIAARASGRKPLPAYRHTGANLNLNDGRAD